MDDKPHVMGIRLVTKFMEPGRFWIKDSMGEYSIPIPEGRYLSEYWQIHLEQEVYHQRLEHWWEHATMFNWELPEETIKKAAEKSRMLEGTPVN